VRSKIETNFSFEQNVGTEFGDSASHADSIRSIKPDLPPAASRRRELCLWSMRP
jgi:hypothetical protein